MMADAIEPVVDRSNFLQLLESGAVTDLDDDRLLQIALAKQIFEGSFEDAFAARATVATRDYVDKPIEVRSAELREGELNGKRSYYMIIRAVDLSTGEMISLNTSALRIMAQVAYAAELNHLPMRVKIVPLGKAKAGRSAPLTLYPHPDSSGKWYNGQS
jgi:hypothetical protein